MAAPMRVSAAKQFFLRRTTETLNYSYRRLTAVTGNDAIDKKLEEVTGGKIGGWLKRYEDVVGLTEVRDAQDKVIQAERGFQEAQIIRRDHQKMLQNIQGKMKDIHTQLDKVQRGDEKYLALITEEYEIIKQEKYVQTELNAAEELERTNFSVLSSAVRESHEKERTRTERTKYWSIMGSMIGATIGILGASLNNYLRNRELRRIVHESAAGGQELRAIVARLADSTQDQHNNIQGFVTDLKGLIKAPAVDAQLTPMKEQLSADSNSAQLEQKAQSIIDEIRRQDVTVLREMEEIKKILMGVKSSDLEGTIVYVGPEMEQLLSDTEKNLEWKIKMNALWTATFTYGALVIAIPILYWIFKGN